MIYRSDYSKRDRHKAEYFDPRTYRIYCRDSAKLAKHFEKGKANDGVLRHADSLFSSFKEENKTLCDYGAGSGRDLTALMESGYTAIGVEPCFSMKYNAIKMHPQIKRNLFASIKEVPFQINGIIFSGVLQHIPRFWLGRLLKQIFIAQPSIKNVLVSVPSSGISRNKDRRQRLMINRDEAFYHQALKPYGFHIIKKWENYDALHRERTWQTLWYERR